MTTRYLSRRGKIWFGALDNDWRRWDACRRRQDDTREGGLLGEAGRARRGGIAGPSVTWASSSSFLALGAGCKARARDLPSPPAADRPAGGGAPVGAGRESPRAHVPARARVGPGHVTRSRGIARPAPVIFSYVGRRTRAHHPLVVAVAPSCPAGSSLLPPRRCARARAGVDSGVA